MQADLARSLADRSAFDAFYGLELVACADADVRARLLVCAHHLQPTGVVHGGVFASIAELLASAGTNWHVTKLGQVGLGMANTTNFLRPIATGWIHGVAVPCHRGRTSWVWDVAMRDDDDHTCAVSRVTIAVREARPA